MSGPEILVVGAGPAGLTLALAAHAHGARVRVVDQRPEAFRPSRAMILHPRTLEILRPYGVAERLLALADTSPGGRLHLGSRVVEVRLAGLALAGTAFPHLSFLRQMDVEELLARALAERGVEIERGTALVGLEDAAASARARLRSPAVEERAEFDFIAGCDGQESAVRACAGIEWRGGSYSEEVVLADVEIDVAPAAGLAEVFVDAAGLLFLFPLGEQATWRLLATRPAEWDNLHFGRPGPPLSAAALQALLDQRGFEARIASVAWSGRYRLQHRLAGRLRSGRLFLAGDAAHAHSPATGQGMNTGIQDAVNLGWKLAFAGRSTDPETLLDSYDLERRRAARRVLALTHVAFWFEASTHPLAAALRRVAAAIGAPLLPALARQRPLVAEAIRLVSQWRMGYPDSPLSIEGLPRAQRPPRAGYRLQDETVTVDGCQVRLHALLAQPGIHVLLSAGAERREITGHGPRVSVHRVQNWPGQDVIGVRPDGYTGYRRGSFDEAQLRRWLGLVGALRPNGTAAPGTGAEVH